jgi:2-methylcitrate dehydratase PrpD
LFALHERGDINLEALTGELGERWELSNVSMKPWPCCRCNHSTIDLAFELRAGGLTAEQVDSVSISMGRVNRDIVGRRYEPHAASMPVVHAQFSAAYAFARALLDGAVTLDSYEPAAIFEPAAVALAQRVEVLCDPGVPDDALEPSRVEVRRHDGAVERSARTQVRGSPVEPMTESEVLEKFHACFAFGVDASRRDADALAAAVLALETLPDAAAAVASGFPPPPIAQLAARN